METLKRVKIPSFLKQKLTGRYGDHYQMQIITLSWFRKRTVSGFVRHYEQIVDYVIDPMEPLTQNLEHKFKTKSKTFTL